MMKEQIVQLPEIVVAARACQKMRGQLGGSPTSFPSDYELQRGMVPRGYDFCSDGATMQGKSVLLWKKAPDEAYGRGGVPLEYEAQLKHFVAMGTVMKGLMRDHVLIKVEHVPMHAVKMKPPMFVRSAEQPQKWGELVGKEWVMKLEFIAIPTTPMLEKVMTKIQTTVAPGAQPQPVVCKAMEDEEPLVEAGTGQGGGEPLLPLERTGEAYSDDDELVGKEDDDAEQNNEVVPADRKESSPLPAGPKHRKTAGKGDSAAPAAGGVPVRGRGRVAATTTKNKRKKHNSSVDEQVAADLDGEGERKGSSPDA